MTDRAPDPSLRPRERFSDRADDYAASRPGYPVALGELLRREWEVGPGWTVADIGSGTGLLARRFLELGCEVYGVEPNDAMRAAGERTLAAEPRFHSVAGSAEATTLSSATIDLVTAGQAFHWFDSAAARVEWARILRPPRRVVLVWNERATDASPFLADYEDLLRRHGPDYQKIGHRYLGDETVVGFHAPGWPRVVLHNVQNFDWDNLQRRLLSTSYIPNEPGAAHDAMLAELRGIFDTHARNGVVDFHYRTVVFLGRLLTS